MDPIEHCTSPQTQTLLTNTANYKPMTACRDNQTTNASKTTHALARRAYNDTMTAKGFTWQALHTCGSRTTTPHKQCILANTRQSHPALKKKRNEQYNTIVHALRKPWENEKHPSDARHYTMNECVLRLLCTSCVEHQSKMHAPDPTD